MMNKDYTESSLHVTHEILSDLQAEGGEDGPEWQSIETFPIKEYLIQNLRAKMADGTIHENVHWVYGRWFRLGYCGGYIQIEEPKWWMTLPEPPVES